MKKTSVVLCILTVSLLFGGQVAWAGKPFFANVTADAQCTTPGFIDAGLIQKDAPSSGPDVSTVVFTLEQHFPGQTDWAEIAKFTIQDVDKQFDLIAAGERYDVAIHDFGNICTLGVVSTEANAIRGVVATTVDNANPNRTGGKVFTGRCISFPNPCR